MNSLPLGNGAPAALVSIAMIAVVLTGGAIMSDLSVQQGITTAARNLNPKLFTA